VQKKRWPFFFFDGLCESLVMLSLSDPSSSSAISSSSASPISTSSLACDTTFGCDGKVASFGEGVDAVAELVGLMAA
jgi:hypothetical protein